MLRYAITPGRLAVPLDEAASISLAGRCAALAREGVDFILVREKHLAAGDLCRLTQRVVHAVRATQASTRVLVAARPDVALAAGADGVHLSSAEGELTPDQVRTLLPRAFVSVSCHTLEEVRRASSADAILFAPVFGKQINGTQVVRAQGLDALREACLASDRVPVFALGGVTAANSRECVAAGAAGIAAIRMFFPEP